MKVDPSSLSTVSFEERSSWTHSLGCFTFTDSNYDFSHGWLFVARNLGLLHGCKRIFTGFGFQEVTKNISNWSLCECNEMMAWICMYKDCFEKKVRKDTHESHKVGPIPHYKHSLKRTSTFPLSIACPATMTP